MRGGDDALLESDEANRRLQEENALALRELQAVCLGQTLLPMSPQKISAAGIFYDQHHYNSRPLDVSHTKSIRESLASTPSHVQSERIINLAISRRYCDSASFTDEINLGFQTPAFRLTAEALQQVRDTQQPIPMRVITGQHRITAAIEWMTITNRDLKQAEDTIAKIIKVKNPSAAQKSVLKDAERARNKAMRELEHDSVWLARIYDVGACVAWCGFGGHAD